MFYISFSPCPVLYFSAQTTRPRTTRQLGPLLALGGVIFTSSSMTYICHLLINPKRAFCRSTALSTAVFLVMLYKLPITILPDFSMKLMISFFFCIYEVHFDFCTDHLQWSLSSQLGTIETFHKHALHYTSPDYSLFFLTLALSRYYPGALQQSN